MESAYEGAVPTAPAATSNTTPSAKALFDWEDIKRLPDDVNKRAELRRHIDDALQRQFRNWLEGESLDARDGESLVKLFDKFIVEMARDCGPRVLLSELVLARVLQWFVGGEDENGTRGPIKGGVGHLERFAKAMVQNAKVRMGDTSQEIDPDRGKTYKREATTELRLLQARLKAAAETKWTDIEAIIQADPQTFPRLSQSLGRLRGFCRAEPDICSSFATGDVAPASFFDQWGGWSTTLEPEYYRQKMSSRR
jgi:hypothetical protein